MSVQNLTDEEKIYKWNDLCITYGWVGIGETEKFLEISEVRFTPLGSVLSPIKLSAVASDMSAIDTMVKETPIKGLAHYVTNVLCANIIFPSVDLETAFWKSVIERLVKDHNVFMDPEIIPSYIRNILKYPSDTGEIGV